MKLLCWNQWRSGENTGLSRMARKIRVVNSGSSMFMIGIVLSVIAIVVVTYVIGSNYFKLMNITEGENGSNKIKEEYRSSPSQNNPNVIVVQSGGEGSNQNNPFIYENERNMERPPAKPFYYPTRGLPQSYQQMGVLIGEERRHKGEQTILPLIGRQTHPGSSRYHYYTSTNGYHPMKLPVIHKKRTCNDNTGCEEIFSGNLVSVNGYDFDFKADIYPSPDLQYIL